MPALRSTGAASGAVRYRTSARAASGSLGGAADAGSKADIGLHLGRDESDKFDARYADDPRRNHHHHVGFAARHHLDGVFRRHRPHLRLHLLADAHAARRGPRSTDAARAFARIGDSLWRQAAQP